MVHHFCLDYVFWIIKKNKILVQIVNIGSDSVNLKILVSGLTLEINSLSSSTTILTSSNMMDENSFLNPTKVKYSLTVSIDLRIVLK